MSTFGIVILVIVILIVLGVLGGGITVLSDLIVGLLDFGWRSIGLIVFIFFIYALYKIGGHEKVTVPFINTEQQSTTDNINFKNSTVIVDCKTLKFTYMFQDDNGEIKTNNETIESKYIDIKDLNKFETVILKNPKHGLFKKESFAKGEIKFLNKHKYLDSHRNDEILDWR
jgi:phosphotransferase system  glucose/maltose/N-acetylglucosamine-specific IIC component